MEYVIRLNITQNTQLQLYLYIVHFFFLVVHLH